jgi:predicted dithiol-disulfide oxidoreductase (DUF899 family)
MDRGLRGVLILGRRLQRLDRPSLSSRRHDGVRVACPARPARRLQAADGWSFPWASTGQSDFNFDFGVSVRGLDAGAPAGDGATHSRADGSAEYNFTKEAFGAELPGLSAFAVDKGAVYRTYSCYGRGLDAFNVGYLLLDRARAGRNENDFPVPVVWIRRTTSATTRWPRKLALAVDARRGDRLATTVLAADPFAATQASQ